MAYRKITVGETTYRYVIGKVNTKVVDLGLFLNADYGYPDGVSYPVSGVIPTPDQVYRYIVTPGIVREMILHKTEGKAPEPYRRECKKHNFVMTSVITDPFTSEIHEKYHRMGHCPECYLDARDEI